MIPSTRRAFGVIPQRRTRNSLPPHNACVFFNPRLELSGRHQKKGSPHAHRWMRMASVRLLLGFCRRSMRWAGGIAFEVALFVGVGGLNIRNDTIEALMRRLPRKKRVTGLNESYKRTGGNYDRSGNSNHHRSRQSYSIRCESIRHSHPSRLRRNFIQCVLHKS